MNKHLLISCIVFSLVTIRLDAANDNYLFGGRQAGMGDAAVSLYDFWAISHNQAGLARLNNPVGGFYFENRYLVKEMGLGAAAVAVPTNSGVFGLSLSYFGYSLYHESKIGLAYARSFSEKLSVGIQFNYMYTFIGGNYSNSTGNVGLELGMIYELLPGLYAGAHIFNPTRAKIASVDNLHDEYIPTIIRFGMSYHFSDRVIVSLESEKDIERRPVFKAGVEYQPAELFYIRGGIGTNPTQNAFGFGIHTGSFTIDLSSSFHHVLGYSPQASIIYELK